MIEMSNLEKLVLVCIGISIHETNTGFKQGYQLIQKKIGSVFERYP